MIHIWRPLWGRGGGGEGGGVKKKLYVIGLRGVGISECSGRPIFIFFVKENWICAMTRHYAELDINI